MTKFHQEHRAYKFQIVVSVVSHKAVHPAGVTQLQVALASEMVAVYADAVPPLDDVNSKLLNFIEVYEHNGSGWVFSNFASLQLTLWHLDPLCASAFVPLPRWIQAKRVVVNVTGTVAVHSERMDKYMEHFFFTLSCYTIFYWFICYSEQFIMYMV